MCVWPTVEFIGVHEIQITAEAENYQCEYDSFELVVEGEVPPPKHDSPLKIMTERVTLSKSNIFHLRSKLEQMEKEKLNLQIQVYKNHTKTAKSLFLESQQKQVEL